VSQHHTTNPKAQPAAAAHRLRSFTSPTPAIIAAKRTFVILGDKSREP